MGDKEFQAAALMPVHLVVGGQHGREVMACGVSYYTQSHPDVEGVTDSGQEGAHTGIWARVTCASCRRAVAAELACGSETAEQARARGRRETLAEVRAVVAKAWQGHGIGHSLMLIDELAAKECAS